MFALAAGTLHWFNPFVHVLRKDVSTWGVTKLDASKITYKKAVPLSVKLPDEHHFTPAEWKDILLKIESGEIRVESE